ATLRPGRTPSFDVRQIIGRVKALELHTLIHVFAALSRFIAEIDGLQSKGCNILGYQMDSQSRAFEAPVEEYSTGTPLRCPRPMTAQSLVPWTPSRAVAALIMTMV